LEILKYTPKKAAKLLYKLLTSAVSNAVSNFKQDQKALIIKEIIVTKGPTLKRGVPVSRGRTYPILKRTSHITLILEIDTTAVKTTKSKNSAKTETTETSSATVKETKAKKTVSKKAA